MPDLNLTLSQAREKLAAKQDDLGKCFAEAKTDDGKTYDFKKITKATLKSALGDDTLTSSIDIAKRINEKDAELNELGEYVETLEASEKAAGNHAARAKVKGHVIMPEEKGGRERPRVKSLGELLSEEKGLRRMGEARPHGRHRPVVRRCAAFGPARQGHAVRHAGHQGADDDGCRLCSGKRPLARLHRNGDPAAADARHHPHEPDRPGRDQVHGGNHPQPWRGREGRGCGLRRERVRLHRTFVGRAQDHRQPAGDRRAVRRRADDDRLRQWPASVRCPAALRPSGLYR
jgi:hypothetical protein